MRTKKCHIIYILIFVVVTIVMDIPILPTIFPEKSMEQIIIVDVIALLFCGILGINIALETDLPVFYNRQNSTNIFYSVIFIGVFIIFMNTSVWINTSKQDLEVIPWINSLTPLTAIFVSVRAAITEEIIFRLFAFSTLVYGLRKLINTEETVIVLSIILSSLIFSLLLHTGSFISLLCGIGLAVIYYKSGLVPAMIVHFFADVIPFVLVAITR